MVGDDTEQRPFRALEESFHVDLALWKEYMGPYSCMLKKGPAPMAAYVTGSETIRLGMKVGGDEGKHVQRNAVDVNEGIPPLANACQRGRNIPAELGDVVGGPGEAVEKLTCHCSRPHKRGDVSQRTTENRRCVSVPRSERKRAEKATGPFQGMYARPLRGGRVADSLPPPDVIGVFNATPGSNSLAIPLSYSQGPAMRMLYNARYGNATHRGHRYTPPRSSPLHLPMASTSPSSSQGAPPLGLSRVRRVFLAHAVTLRVPR